MTLRLIALSLQDFIIHLALLQVQKWALEIHAYQ